jgi:hypothetical protein
MHWVVATALIVLAIGTPRSWRRVWRSTRSDPFWVGKPGVPRTIFRGMFGPNFASFIRREAVPSAVGIGLLGVLTTDVAALQLPAAVGFFGTLSLAVAVWAFNRPRFLIPPPLRDDPGAVRVWLNRRRAQRASQRHDLGRH